MTGFSLHAFFLFVSSSFSVYIVSPHGILNTNNTSQTRCLCIPNARERKGPYAACHIRSLARDHERHLPPSVRHDDSHCLRVNCAPTAASTSTAAATPRRTPHIYLTLAVPLDGDKFARCNGPPLASALRRHRHGLECMSGGASSHNPSHRITHTHTHARTHTHTQNLHNVKIASKLAHDCLATRLRRWCCCISAHLRRGC